MAQWGNNVALELERIQVPSKAIPPGNAFEVIVTIKNSAAVIFNDPDSCVRDTTPCSKGTFAERGYCVNTVVQIGSQIRDESTCVNKGIIPPARTDFVFEMSAPEQEGNYEVSAYATGTASGNQSSPQSTSVTVSSDTTDTGDGDDNGGSGSRAGYIEWAKNNPEQAAVVAGAGYVAFRTFTGEIAEEIIG